ncbi:uncharacterized protein LOC115535872 [Gadus morhua]|uniref:uncharacterized protein LOC115535872 n=1 Tax=Gadus morhua TaxID=8049 RepID=UPI0011B5E0B5|nr:uncharacterized protein LOC115535872 [Gadus morhua]
MPLLSRRQRALPRKHSKKTPYSITRVMAGYQRCISLALLCLLLCHDSLGVNSKACTETRTSTPFPDSHFLPDDQPEGFAGSTWKDYVKIKPLLPGAHSFLYQRDKNDVMDVCKDKGGRQFPGQSKRDGWDFKESDLCISNKKFKFRKVTIDTDPSVVPQVIDEEKYLILGCVLVNKVCVPSHFEGNYHNEEPNVLDKGCAGGVPPK